MRASVAPPNSSRRRRYRSRTAVRPRAAEGAEDAEDKYDEAWSGEAFLLEQLLCGLNSHYRLVRIDLVDAALEAFPSVSGGTFEETTSIGCG
ncbi:MAG: hypothetical protein JO062_15500 [Bryobacterales bacterium]|nr:hypothetical protein [Bryobacterales bacterium]